MIKTDTIIITQARHTEKPVEIRQNFIDQISISFQNFDGNRAVLEVDADELRRALDALRELKL